MAHRRGGSAKEGDTGKEEYGNFQVGALSYFAVAPPPNQSVTFRSWFYAWSHDSLLSSSCIVSPVPRPNNPQRKSLPALGAC